MKTEHRKKLIEADVRRTDFFQNSIKKINETLEKFVSAEEKSFYLISVIERLEDALDILSIKKAESTEPEGPDEFNIDEETLKLVLEFASKLLDYYSKDLVFSDDQTAAKKTSDIKETEETRNNLPELPDSIRQKIELVLSVEERKKLDGYIKELATDTLLEQKNHESGLLQKKEVIKMFGVSQVTINAWMKKGLIPFKKIDRRVFFKKSDIDLLLYTNPKLEEKAKKAKRSEENK